MLEAETSVAAQASLSVGARDFQSGTALPNYSYVGDAHQCAAPGMPYAIAEDQPRDRSRGKRQGD